MDKFIIWNHTNCFGCLNNDGYLIFSSFKLSPFHRKGFKVEGSEASKDLNWNGNAIKCWLALTVGQQMC